jgi:hypothetical protein
VARDCETDRGRVLPDQSIKLVNQAQEPIAPVPETSPGIEVNKYYRQGVEYFLVPEIPAVPEKNPAVEFEDCIYCTSPEYESWRDETYRCYRCEPEPDRNPILTGVTFSAGFLARYSPPQPENIYYKADVNGQLSLLDFEVLSDEPPDPDDFESIDAFREAIALWEAQNPEPLNISLDSMCEWAPCPHEWHEPKAENLPLKASSMIEVMELSTGSGSSITCNFSIPTFGAWCDRSNRSDEPPDTGIFARSPKPKPPTFPPQASQPKSVQVSPSQPLVSQASRNYPETMPKLFHRVVAGNSTQPARSPPGGDAMS